MYMYADRGGGGHEDAMKMHPFYCFNFSAFSACNLLRPSPY